MKRLRLRAGLLWVGLILMVSCLGDRVVAPVEPLPASLAVDRPTVQLFRFARGRMVSADTVRITNNGDGPMGLVERVGGVDYVTQARIGWLRTEVQNLGEERAILILEPTYAEEEQEDADIAEVVLKAEGSPELKRVRVIARTLRGATFEFSVSPLTFAAVPGDPPLAQFLTVRNGGNGTLTIHSPSIHYAGGTPGWLALEAVGGSETTPDFRIQADPESLLGGLHEAFLVFESLPSEETRAKPDSVAVQLNIGQPALSASSSTLSFSAIRGGGDPSPQEISLANSGEGGLPALGALDLGAVVYQVGVGGWLDVSLEGASVRIAPRSGGLDTGPYEALFNVESARGGDLPVHVTLSVEAPILTVGKRTVSFGMVAGDAPPRAQSVVITNTGAGTVSSLGALSLGSLEPSVPWLTASLSGSEIVLTPTPSSTSLGAGDYSTGLLVQSLYGGSDTLSVTLSVSRGLDPPKIALSADEVKFSGVTGDPPPSSQEVQVSNAGGGTLGDLSVGTILYAGETGWLTADLAGTTITLAAITGSLPDGTHHAVVPVLSSKGGDASLEASFSLGSPILTASATSASFTAQEGAPNPAPQKITFSNTGPGTLASLGPLTLGPVFYEGPGGWLTTSLSGQTLTLSVATGALPTGTYRASVRVQSARGGDVAIDIVFSVTRPPDAADLAVSPASVRMEAILDGPNPPAETVILSNAGGGTLGSLSVGGIVYGGGAAGWLSTALDGSILTLGATTGAVPGGAHNATVTISSTAGGSESVEVTLIVRAPVLTLSAGSVGFSGEEGGAPSPASTSVFLLNTGAGDFSSLGTVSLGSISYTGAGGWLDASLGGGGAQVDFTVAMGSLAPGMYAATAPVHSTAGGSASVAVSLTVAPPPAPPLLVLSSGAAAFFAEESGGDPASQDITGANGGGGGESALGSLSLGAITYSGASGWLAASITGLTVTLSPSTGTLPAGLHQATVPVQSGEGGSQDIEVSFTVSTSGDPTDLEVSPTAVRIDAVVGAANPPDQEVLLYNAGSGTLGGRSVVGITYGGASGWLSTSLASSTLKLGADVSGMSAGAYEASVEVESDNGGNEVVAVTLVVSGPVLTLSSQRADFSASEGGTAAPPSISVNLSNTGAGEFSDLGSITLGALSYGGGGGWLSAELAPGSQRVDLSADLTGLAPGSYTATVPVNSGNGGSESILTTATVSPSADPPDLSLSTSVVEFTAILGGGSPVSKAVNVSNGGGGTIDDLGDLALGGITYGGGSSGWLSTSSLLDATLTLAPATGSLAGGIHTATVPVASQFGGDESVAVTLRVGVPVLTASTLGLSFTGQADGTPPGSEAVTFSNTGAGTLEDVGHPSVASVTYEGGVVGWVTEPSAGDPVVGGSLAVVVDQGTLDAGSYTSTVVVTSEYGGDQVITLTLTVVRENDPPRMVLSASSQRFDALVGGVDPDPQQVTASNSGGGSLGIIRVGAPSYGGNATGWASATVDGSTITTRAETGELEAGTYTATVPVSSDGGTTSLEITFVVGTSRLTLSPRIVSFGDTVGGPGPDPTVVTLANTGGGTFASLGTVSLGAPVYAGESMGWLSAALIEPRLLRLQATTGTLLPGSDPYRARVPVVSTAGGNDTVLVSFTVAPGTSPPQLSLSLDSMTFAGIWGGTPPSSQRLEGFNSGGGDLGPLTLGGTDYLMGASGWLDGSVSGSSVTLSPSVEGLSSGIHRARVTVQSAHGGDGSLEVVLNLAPPELTLSTRTVTFSDTVGSTDTLRTQIFLSNAGAGNRASLGVIELGTTAYPQGGPPWLSTNPEQGSAVDGFMVDLGASALELDQGSRVALVPVFSQWGGADTVAVTFATRVPDRSFDLPIIEFVKDSVVNGASVFVPLPGDSVVVGPLAADSAVRVGVRNGSETRVTLSGLRVGVPTYEAGQPTGWITGAFLDQTTAAFDDPAQLIIVLDPTGLGGGRHQGRLVISSETPGLEEVEPKVLKVVLVVN